MTYKEACEAGYRWYRVAWTRGYLSRKTDVLEQPVLENRFGEMYVETPSWKSTWYHHRYYIRKTLSHRARLSDSNGKNYIFGYDLDYRKWYLDAEDCDDPTRRGTLEEISNIVSNMGLTLVEKIDND